MPPLYSEILKPQQEFQRSINLSLDMGNLDYLERYIPTRASSIVLERYLRAVLTPGADRASVLIGPYGKGKSHALFVVLELLSENDERADAVFEKLANQLAEVNEDAAELVRRIRHEGIRFLPVIINDRYLDIRQAFLASLRSALATAGLAHLMPDNYYQQCLLTIERWKQGFPETHKAYVDFVRAHGKSIGDYENALRQYDAEELTLFQECHRAILAGAEFDPLLESDVPTLYTQVNRLLREHSPYSGMFVVFDEFGKYLEASVAYHETPRFKVLQDLAELCCRSKDYPLLMTCISHKAISDYAAKSARDLQNSFRTIEGRFSSIYFTSTFEGSFTLISGALGREKSRFQAFLREHSYEYAQTVNECENLGCFSGYQSSVEQIVYQCFPMHPLTALSLMKLSEKAAQNERTLFTYLADSKAPLAGFIAANKGSYELATVDTVYDYFHTTIKENSYDPELRELVIYSDALLPSLNEGEQKLVKAITLFSMVVDNCLLAKADVLCSALQWSEQELSTHIQSLERAHRIYVRRSDGVLCLMRTTTESVRKDIEYEVSVRRGRIDLAEQLSELRDAGYTIPRRYNDKHEIVRYFLNVYVTTEQFMKQPTCQFLTERGFADGYVVYLLGQATAEDVQRKLLQWKCNHVAVLLPQVPFSCREAIEECAAISRLLTKATDDVAIEELGYYFEDMLQVVNRGFAEMFDTNPLCITSERCVPCTALSAEVSRLCDEILYPLTPVINHEMMNRSVVSGQMRLARAKVVDAILQDAIPADRFAVKSAEASIVRAFYAHIDDDNMRQVIALVDEYLKACEETQQPISILFDKLVQPPYGLRKGILPILIAHCFRGRVSQITLYNGIQEQQINGETLNYLGEQYDSIFVRVDVGSAEQQAYLHILGSEFTPGADTVNLRDIFEAMRKTVRSLPRCARANRKLLQIDSDGNVSAYPLAQSDIELRQVLVRQDGNARDALLTKLPKACGLHPNEMCAKSIVAAICDRLKGYAKTTYTALGTVIRKRLGATKNTSIRGAMTTWLQSQPTGRLNRMYEANTQALLSVFRNGDDHSDTEWISMLAIALTGLPVEDWSDQQAEDFDNLLDSAVSAVEAAPDDVEEADEQRQQIQVSLGNRRLSQALPARELEGMEVLVYNSVRSAFDEFGDALSAEEKLLVLANLLVRLNDKE